MIQSGLVTPGTKSTPAGGGVRSCSTTWLLHVGAPPSTESHLTRINWYSSPTRTTRYDTFVMVTTGLPPTTTELFHVSSNALDPSVTAPGGHAGLGPHGMAAGSVSSDSDDARSVGMKKPTFCSERELLARPIVLSRLDNMTLVANASEVARIAVRVTLTSNSGSVMPASF